MTGYTILSPIHLGKGPKGEARENALRELAVQRGHVHDGRGSIGKLIVEIADQEINKVASKNPTISSYGAAYIIVVPDRDDPDYHNLRQVYLASRRLMKERGFEMVGHNEFGEEIWSPPAPTSEGAE